jgi:DNA invertase Pin-like site-specific DNA recombinase
MRKVGYARVSSTGQNLDRQLGALVAQRCDRFFQEKASGKSIKNRPELEKAMLAFSTAVWMWGMGRCTRSSRRRGHHGAHQRQRRFCMLDSPTWI